MKPARQSSGNSRRQFLKNSSAIGGAVLISGLAGCSSDGNDNGNGNSSGNGSGNGNGNSQEEYQLTMGIGAEGTVGGNSGQALQRVTSEVTDSVDYNGQYTDGDPASMNLFNRGEIDGYTSGTFAVGQAVNDEGAFADNPIDNLALQGFTHGVLSGHMLALADSGIETYDDMVGENIWVFPPSWGLREISKQMLEKAGLWSDLEPNVEPIALGDIAGAIEEGRVSAIATYGANYNGMVGWVQDSLARFEWSAIETTPDVEAAIEEQSGMVLSEVNVDDMYGDLDEDFGVDSIMCYDMTYNSYFGEDVPADVVKEVLTVANENIDMLQESFANFLNTGDISNMTNGINTDLAVHPGAEEFFKENDAWNDDWSTV